MLKAVLFDVDDTLIDWEHFSGHWEAIESIHLEKVYRHVMGERPPCTFDLYITEYMSRLREAWGEARSTLRAPHVGRVMVDTSIAMGAPIDTVDMEACLTAYAWKAVKDTRVFPDVPEGLALLRDRGLKLGLVTNSAHPIVLRDLELAEHDLLQYFPECRVTAADAGYLKPHAAIFEYALDCLGVSADEVVFVGDNVVADIAGAQSAGLKAIQRLVRDRQPAHKGLVIPDATITSLLELPAILDQWFPAFEEQR
ncbi:MAG: HAD family hydrolase [Anaerolineae bacterium]|jgi:putative hydrolase of the HAD superfamily|nr:HAD family hydrolase [Anaerolineae bacterium]